jgi:hypothetical protein
MTADIHTIIWPGDTDTRPRGWLFPRNKTLNIAIPAKGGYGEFVRYENDPKGFSIDVFQEVVASLPYKVPMYYLPFEDGRGENNGTLDKLVYKVYLKVCVDFSLLHFAFREHFTIYLFNQLIST